MKYFAAIIILVLLSSCHRDATVKGVVTYYSHGTQADVGASIYIIPVADSLYTKEVLLLTHIFNAEYKDKSRTDDPHEQQSAADWLQKHNVLDPAKYDEEDKLANKFLSDFLAARGAKSVTADGTGAFSIIVPSGEYFIITRSAHRYGYGLFDLGGKIDIIHRTVESGQDNIVDTKFF